MYEAHFGLAARPFAETTDPAAYLALPSRESALRRLRYALDRGAGAALLFGPAGSGKTQLARVLAGDRKGPVVHLTFPAMPAADVLAYVADELGVPAIGSGLASAVRRLKAHLAAGAARGRRPLLLVDEAHLIDDAATFEALRLLLNFASGGPPDLDLVLVGQPELLLRLPPALGDRLGARALLGTLTEAESAAYLRGRLASAGAGRELFTPEALTALHHAGDSLPRRLNRLADLALLIAYADGQETVDVESVTPALRELEDEALAA